MSEYTLWCLIEGDKTPFSVNVMSTTPIDDLKTVIKDKTSHSLEKFAAKDLIIWKLDADYNDPAIQESISNGQYQPLPLPVPNDKPLNPMKTISAWWPTPLPDGQIQVFVGTPTKMSPVVHAPGEKPENELAPMVTLVIVSQSTFERLDTVERNNIYELYDEPPPFLTEFRTKLRQHRWIESGEEDIVACYRNKSPSFNDLFDDYFQSTPIDVQQRGLNSGTLVLLHFALAFIDPAWKEGNIRESNVRWIFDKLAHHFKSIFRGNESHGFSCDWPSKIIVEVETEKKEFCYTPRSDFHMALDRLIYLLVEVQSNTDKCDKYRMLLQAACAARLGRALCNKPFIVVALYIENSGTVIRYFVFQRGDGDPKVSYVKDVQDWTDPKELFNAMFELYNLVSIIQSDRPGPGNIAARIESLTSYISENFKEQLKLKSDADQDGNNPAKRNRVRGGEGDNIGLGLQYGEDVYEDPEVVKGLTQAGLTLDSYDEDKDGWAPMNQLNPNMRHVKLFDCTPCVVKLLHPDSDELQILQDLHSKKSRDNHTIPLIEALELNGATFIVLPTAYPLDLELKLGKLSSSTILDLSRQLIEGVGFMHRHGIAHLDINPGNMVVLGGRLFIIDYDISVYVKDPDALIDRWCGTPRWMAPEIGHKDSPKRWYSPIRADLWSCGQTLKYLADKGGVNENPFKPLIRQLLDIDPQRRPLLHLDTVERLVERSLSEPRVSLKRKADALSPVVK